MKTFRKSKKYQEYFKSKTVRKFTSREDCYLHLETNVFTNAEFISNVTETAWALQISYLLAYELITNYLTDVAYELDQAQANLKSNTRINVFGYLTLHIGFMRSFKNKKMFLEKLLIFK